MASNSRVDQPAATLWYHPHPHHDTARQTYMGLAGPIIVDDGNDHRLGLPHNFGIDDLPIIIQDRAFGAEGSLEYDSDELGILRARKMLYSSKTNAEAIGQLYKGSDV